MSISPNITIVVCTYNRSQQLKIALESLICLNLEGYTAEILVVDNNSTDDTSEVVHLISRNSPIEVRYARETRQGVVPARNCGVVEARGDWIAFFDDDQVADPDWLVRLLEVAERHKVQCVGGAVRLKLPDGFKTLRSPFVRTLLGETVGMDTERQYNRRFTPGCGNLLVHRSVFERVGLFNPEWVHQRGEDTDLWRRIADADIAGWYTPAAVIYHVIPPERLESSYLQRLSSMMVEGMAEDEHRAYGSLYPLVWFARVGQAALVLWPRWLWATLTLDKELGLGARCRLSIANKYLRNGLRLMTMQQ